jgi:hypothetical protein
MNAMVIAPSEQYNFLQHLTRNLKQTIQSKEKFMKHIKFLPLALLTLLVLKQLVHGVDLAGMGVTIALTAVIALKDYLEKQKHIQEIEAHVKKELEDVKHVINTQNEVIEKMAKALDDVRTKAASIQLSQGYQKKFGT